MMRKASIMIVFVFISQFQRECYSQTTTANSIIDIAEIIKLKENDKRQQTMLIDFEKGYKINDRIVVEEFENYYELIVSHLGKNGYTGGAEGYTMDKKTGKIKMVWHEHPMKLPELRILKRSN